MCLSIDLSNAELDVSNDDLLYNGVKLQQLFLQSMTELTQFHFYTKFNSDLFDAARILPTFSNEFWLDHKWFIGIHGNYIYTLPFRFEQLHHFKGFEGDSIN